MSNSEELPLDLVCCLFTEADNILDNYFEYFNDSTNKDDLTWLKKAYQNKHFASLKDQRIEKHFKKLKNDPTQRAKLIDNWKSKSEDYYIGLRLSSNRYEESLLSKILFLLSYALKNENLFSEKLLFLIYKLTRKKIYKIDSLTLLTVANPHSPKYFYSLAQLYYFFSNFQHALDPLMFGFNYLMNSQYNDFHQFSKFYQLKGKICILNYSLALVNDNLKLSKKNYTQIDIAKIVINECFKKYKFSYIQRYIKQFQDKGQINFLAVKSFLQICCFSFKQAMKLFSMAEKFIELSPESKSKVFYYDQCKMVINSYSLNCQTNHSYGEMYKTMKDSDISPIVLAKVAESCFINQQYKDSLYLYQQLRRRYYDNDDFDVLIARIYVGLHQFDKAANILNQVDITRLAGHSKTFFQTLIYGLWGKIGEHQKAINFLLQCNHPTTSYIKLLQKFFLIINFMKAKNNDTAYQIYDQVYEQFKKSKEQFYFLALLYLRRFSFENKFIEREKQFLQQIYSMIAEGQKFGNILEKWSRRSQTNDIELMLMSNNMLTSTLS